MSETTDTNEDVTGLKNKNADLIRQNKEYRERAERAEREKDEAAEDAANQNSTELEKMQKRAEKAEREAKAANERAEDNAKSLRDYKATNAITAALTSANVDNSHIAILTKALRADVEFDDAGEPLIGGKSIDAYTKSYFAKEGATYVRAADHNGGGASGSEGSKSGQWSKPPETPDELHNWMKYTITNKDDAIALSNTWQRADLRP